VTHATPLQISMLADHGLPSAESLVLSQHVEDCAACKASLTKYRNEVRLLQGALQQETSAASEALEIPPTMPVPKFSRPATLRGFALANVTTGLVIWLAQFLWKTIFGELIMNTTSWITSIYLPDMYAMFSSTALYLLEEGTAMLDAYLVFIVMSLVTASGLWLLLKARKNHAVIGMGLFVFLAGALVTPTPAQALEIRRGEDVVTIAASETIEDTLLVAAETILIEGTVTGDIVAVGRRVNVSGTVGGNLITFAEFITVSGNVGGSALGAAASFDLHGGQVQGDVWLAGEKVNIDREASVAGNATVATESATIEGSIGRDLHAFAETVEVSGNLGEDLEAFSAHLRLLGDASVAGDVRFHTHNKDQLHRDAGVQVGGTVEFLDMPKEFDRENRYTSLEFYLWQIARLLAAVIVGIALFWLIPSLRSTSFGTGVDALKTAGFGLLALIGVPIFAVLLAVTVVGIPLSVIVLAGWGLTIYLAKIIVGAVVGRMMLSEETSLPVILLAGLAAVIVMINIPFIGGVISVALTLVGLGLLVQHLLGNLSAKA